jgi:AraC-like DNA-binding protein
MPARRDPIREWREGFARQMHSIDFKPLPDTPFRARIVPVLDGVHTALSPGLTFRDEELVKDGGGEAFALIMCRSRNLEVAQLGREARLGRGDATLLHVSETGHLGSKQSFEFVVQMIPYAELEARGARLDGAVAQRLPARTEALQLLRAAIRSFESRKPAFSEEARGLLRRHIADLAALAFTSHAQLGESAASAVVDARLAAALDEIAARYREPGFGVAEAARRQGISARYLQRLLEMSGTTFTARVNELRLQRALALLTDAGDGPQRISDIALLAGFSDISQFNRLFRSRFGDTPSAVRAQSRRAP